MSAGKKSNSVDFGFLGDKKLEKGKKATIEQSNAWKNPSSKERKEDEKETKRALKKVAARQGEKTSFRKKALGIGGVVFMFGVGIFNFISTVMDFVSGNGVITVDLSDTAAVKDMLFGGQPWLVYCVNNQTMKDRVPKVLEDSSSVLWSDSSVKVAVLSCWDATSSGRSVAQRFQLRQSPPLSFLVAHGNKPRVVNLVGVSKPEDLLKKIKPGLKLEISKIDSLKKWPSQCTSRRTCIVVGHKKAAHREIALNVIKPLSEKHRGSRFVTLDTAFWQLKLDDAVLATRKAEKGGADVLCLARDDAAGGKNTSYSGAFLPDLSGAAAFVTACEKRQGLAAMPAVPKIKARPSKPKTVKAPPVHRPTPKPTPAQPKKANVDRVGSRETMEREEEPLFEAIEEEEGDGEEAAGETGDEDGEDDSEGSQDEPDDDEESIEL